MQIDNESWQKEEGAVYIKSSVVEWQQVRIQAAIAAMSIVADDGYNVRNEQHLIAKHAVELADALVEELKGGQDDLIKVIKENQVPRAQITCQSCGSILEYGNGDLYKDWHTDSAISSAMRYDYYFNCPVCDCKVDVRWIPKK